MNRIPVDYYLKLGNIRDILEEIDVNFIYNIDEDRQLYNYIIYEFIDKEAIGESLTMISLDNLHYMESDLEDWIYNKQSELEEIGYDYKKLRF